MENIVEKDKIAHFERFPPFPQCLPKTFFFQCVEMSIYGVYMEERVESCLLCSNPLRRCIKPPFTRAWLNDIIIVIAMLRYPDHEDRIF